MRKREFSRCVQIVVRRDPSDGGQSSAPPLAIKWRSKQTPHMLFVALVVLLIFVHTINLQSNV